LLGLFSFLSSALMYSYFVRFEDSMQTGTEVVKRASAGALLKSVVLFLVRGNSDLWECWGDMGD